MAHRVKTKTTTGETRYIVKYRGPDGRQHEQWFKTRRPAERFEATVTADVLRGQWIDPRAAKRTVADVATQWRGSNPAKRASTFAADDSALDVHIVPALGHRAIGAVTPTDVQELVTAMSSRLKPRTVRRVYGVLRAVFRFAEQSDFIGRTPCRGINLPAVNRTSRRQMATEDVEKPRMNWASSLAPWLGSAPSWASDGARLPLYGSDESTSCVARSQSQKPSVGARRERPSSDRRSRRPPTGPSASRRRCAICSLSI